MKKIISILWRLYFGMSFFGKTAVSAFVSIVMSFPAVLFKLILGIVSGSLVWIYSAVYAAGASVSRFLYTKCLNVEVTERKKSNYVLAISIILIISAALFNICILIKQIMNDAGERFPVPIVIIASLYFFGFYVFTIRGLFQLRKHKEIEFYAYKIIGVSGSLVNMVLLQRMLLSCTAMSAEMILNVNSSFGYITGGTMAFSAVLLLVRVILYRKALKRNVE